MGFIWWIIKTVLKLALLLVLIAAGYLVYKNYTGTNISLSVPQGIEKVEFEDGSYAQVNAPKGWCPATDMMGGFFGQLQKQVAGHLIIGYIYNSECDLINQENYKSLDFLMIFPFEFSAEHACKGQKRNTYQLNAPGGDANSCIVESEDFKSGYAVSINYPISQTKSLQFVAGADLWKEKYTEILNMIKTTRYVGASQ